MVAGRHVASGNGWRGGLVASTRPVSPPPARESPRKAASRSPRQCLQTRRRRVVRAGSFSLCPLRPLQPPIPASLEPRLRHFEDGLVTVSVGIWWSRQHNAMQRPEEPDSIREAPALVDATDIPGAPEHGVIDCVLVDAVAKAGRAHRKGHRNTYISQQVPKASP